MKLQVVPTDDGTFQNDVLLTVKQSNYLINAINNPESRQKRQSLFLDGLPSEKWDVSSPIKYVFDSSLGEFELPHRHFVFLSLRSPRKRALQTSFISVPCLRSFFDQKYKLNIYNIF